MSDPAVKLGPWSGGADSSSPGPVEGVDGFRALVPVVEPGSVGAPPVAPDLVREVRAPFDVRMVRACSGQPVTCPNNGEPRARFTVGWKTVTRVERYALILWARDVVQGTRFGWDLEVDGIGGSTTRTVRFLEDPTISWKGTAAFELEEIEVEELV